MADGLVKILQQAIIEELNKESPDTMIIQTLENSLNDELSKTNHHNNIPRIVYDFRDRLHIIINRNNNRSSFEDDHDDDKPRPTPQPTLAVPGSLEKILILEQRYANGESLWNKNDATLNNVTIPEDLLTFDDQENQDVIEESEIQKGFDMTLPKNIKKGRSNNTKINARHYNEDEYDDNNKIEKIDNIRNKNKKRDTQKDEKDW